MGKMLAIAAITAVTITSTLVATTGNADAHFGPVIGLGIATGMVISTSAPNERCSLVRQFDQYGNYTGRTWVCGIN